MCFPEFQEKTHSKGAAQAITDESQSEVDAAVKALDDALNAAKAAVAAAGTPGEPEEPSNPDEPDPPTPDAPSQGDPACKWCGKPHTGFRGGIVHFFHHIFCFFARLFGKRDPLPCRGIGRARIIRRQTIPNPT